MTDHLQLSSLAVQQLKHRYGVVHFGKRDQYQVAVSLAEIGALERLFTDFYTPSWLLALLHRVAPNLAQRSKARCDPGLSDRLATSLLLDCLWVSRWRVRKLKPEQVQQALDDMASRFAADYAARHPQVGMISYSYHWKALSAARAAGQWGGPAIVFQVHPIAQQISRILRDDRSKTGLSYSPDAEELQPRNESAEYVASLQYADGILAASQFTARGLIEEGIAPSKVAVVPYGVAMTESPITRPTEEPRWHDEYPPLQLLWVGQLAYRKGAHHLFAALRHFSPKQVRLDMVTRSRVPAELQALMPPSVSIHHSITDLERKQMYRTHHLFVLPSMVEGFGLVYLEALAEGLPVLCTPNTGGADLISDGVEGFVVESSQSDAIAARIEMCLSNPLLLPQMSMAARRTATQWTWPRFRQNVRNCIAEFERSY